MASAPAVGRFGGVENSVAPDVGERVAGVHRDMHGAAGAEDLADIVDRDGQRRRVQTMFLGVGLELFFVGDRLFAIVRPELLGGKSPFCTRTRPAWKLNEVRRRRRRAAAGQPGGARPAAACKAETMLPATVGARAGKTNMMSSPREFSSRRLPERKPSPNPTRSNSDPTPHAIPNMVRKERSLCAHRVRNICRSVSKNIMGLRDSNPL